MDTPDLSAASPVLPSMLPPRSLPADYITPSSASSATLPVTRVSESSLPPLTLVLGAAGAGKTEWTIDRFVHAWQAGEAPVLLLLSSPQQAEARAEQIAARLNCAVADIRPLLTTFRGLANDVTRTDNDGMRPIGRAFQRLALADLVRTTLRADDFLGRMLNAPGFVPALADRLREWKLAGLTPDRLEACGSPLAETLCDPNFVRKSQELARLFRAYETFLERNHLRDEEDYLRVARERLADTDIALPYKARGILVDGFYRFNTQQRLLLAAIAWRAHSAPEAVVETAVTLPFESRRPLLFAAPSRTLLQLRREFACNEILLQSHASFLPPSLRLLRDRLFESAGEEGSEKTEDRSQRSEGKTTNAPHEIENTQPDLSHSPTPYPLHPVLRLFDAPNPYVEAEMVAREFRRLYAAGGMAWSDFAVILRAMGDYAPILAAIFERYDIPLGVDGPELLAENPLLKTVLHLLAIVRRGWQRDDVLAFLKSSYTAPDKLEADALRQRARRAGVREGREHWLALVQHDPETRLDAEGALRPNVAATLRDLAHYDTLLTRDRLEPRAFADLVWETITDFGMEARIAQGDPTRQQRDRAALKEAEKVLDALAQMATLSGRHSLPFADLCDELQRAWQGASSIAIAEGDRVRVAEPYDARERSLKVAAVMGLTERVFPRRITEDPFLRDEERVLLRAQTGIELEAQKGRADDERFFFYLAVTAPAERLILSYPRSADEADTLPSFYLDEVRAVFDRQKKAEDRSQKSEGRTANAQCKIENTQPDLSQPTINDNQHPKPNTQHSVSYPLPPEYLELVSRTLADVAPRPQETQSDSDRLLAACAGLFDPGATGYSRANLRQSLALLQECFAEAGGRERVRQIVAARALPALPRLHDARLRQAFTGGKSVFLIRELQSYGNCPFQYFLRYVLRLRPEQEGTHEQAQDTLLHSVLNRYFREHPHSAQVDAEAMRRTLHSLLAETLDGSTMDASPSQLRITHRLLADALDGFVVREQRFREQFGMRPCHFNLTFGFGANSVAEGLPDQEPGQEEDRAANTDGDEAGWQRVDGSPADPLSCAEPLLLNVQDGGAPVALRGVIDRLDVDATGQRVLALDYLLGKPPDYSEIQRGQSLQMPLHLLAVERLFGKVGAVACYDSMRERGRRRFHRAEHVNMRQFAPISPLEEGTTVTPLNREQYAQLLKTAEATAVRLARAIAQGNIEPTPGDHCRRCAYGDVCRTTLLGGHDGEIIPLLPADRTNGTS